MNEEIDENECRIVAMFWDFESAAGDMSRRQPAEARSNRSSRSIRSSGSKQTRWSRKCLREAHALDPDESELRDEQVG